MPVGERQVRRARTPRRRTWPDDALLAVRAGEGDADAFETLVRRHTPELLRLANRLVSDRGDAEDAVQESLVSAWRRLPGFRRDSEFATWMFRIVTNKCLNQLRARHPTTPLDAVPEPPAPDHTASPARAAETSAAVSDLGKALRILSPEQQACWVLRELYGLSYEDIAAAVGINQKAVRGRIYRARRALTEAMVAWR
ncbi:RNA polymerase sigma factor [Streptomyces sp. 8L]|uniref:RNA polymerase sigma factor n=1 Tax=Streptomyces sp. 8L TaxID=2877242 RepID=UPI001CD61435|nr:RNA polymerase sigma factor [Streptomyces sp. 8L]MCA1221164.1 RNA polymerase sigma factor [Streptomyces sp. 8L]